MSLLHTIHHSLSFAQADPLGGGLAEEIALEQAEPEAAEFQADFDPVALQDAWAKAVDELHGDPDWVDFSADE